MDGKLSLNRRAMMAYTIRAACALCAADRSRLSPVMSLAATPLANEFVTAEARYREQDVFPLTLLLCGQCGHLQLAEIVDPARLFREYVYVSGTSSSFVEHFRRVAESAVERFRLSDRSLIVEVGSNDGTLLRHFQLLGLPRVIGIDPARAIVDDAVRRGIPTIEGFFDAAVAARILQQEGPASFIVANNVFAHAADIRGLASAVRSLMTAGSVFSFEVSYLVDVGEKLLFDTIYHEHVSYHTVSALEPFFESLGLRLFDAERIDAHGGSLRCYVCLANDAVEVSARVTELRALEAALGLFGHEYYGNLKLRIQQRGLELRSQLASIRASGQTICGFGAPAKLTTLMYEFGLEARSFEYVVDDSRWKQGLFTPGSHIAVVPSSALVQHPTDWCVVFAWNFADSIIKKSHEFRASGGRFIVPLPKLEVV